MTPEQVAQVRKAQGLPPLPANNAVASARGDEKKATNDNARDDRKARRKKEKQQAEASARD